jgi:hypothetical protein
MLPIITVMVVDLFVNITSVVSLGLIMIVSPAPRVFSVMTVVMHIFVNISAVVSVRLIVFFVPAIMMFFCLVMPVGLSRRSMIPVMGECHA